MPRGDELLILAAEPRLDPLTREALLVVVDCWFTCSADRALGFNGVGDIPTSAVRAWAKDEGFSREGRRFLISVIRHVDTWRGQREAEKRRTDSM